MALKEFRTVLQRGLQDEGSRLRVEGLWFRVSGSGLRVEGLGFGVCGFFGLFGDGSAVIVWRFQGFGWGTSTFDWV